jgi:hypothetical protein
MWAIVGHWVADRDGGFGVVTTEACDELTVRDALIETDVPLRAVGRVWLEFVGGADDADAVVKLVKAK